MKKVILTVLVAAAFVAACSSDCSKKKEARKNRDRAAQTMPAENK